MEAGRDLDIAVAQRVCGLLVMLEAGSHRVLSPRHREAAPLPHYSTVTEHAYYVIDFLHAQGFFCRLQSGVREGEPWYTVSFYRQGEAAVASSGDTLPLAISRAACRLADLRPKTA
jgi:hypothetical protein